MFTEKQHRERKKMVIIYAINRCLKIRDNCVKTN